MCGFAVQAPSGVVMLRSHPNPRTAAGNVFQTADAERKAADIARAAYGEVARMAESLRKAGVTVHLSEDGGRATPNSVLTQQPVLHVCWTVELAGGSVRCMLARLHLSEPASPGNAAASPYLPQAEKTL